MDPGQAGVAGGQCRGDAVQHPVRPVAAGQEEPPEHPLLLAQEPGRLPEPQPGGDPDQLLPAHRAGQADPDRQPHPGGGDPAGPPHGGGRIEAQLGDDLRGVGRLRGERARDQLVGDPAVPLRVAADPDPVEPVTGDLVQLGEQSKGVRIAAHRLGGVTADDEQRADPRVGEPVGEIGQVRPVPDQPGREVRRHPVAVPGEPDGELHGRVEPLRLGGRDAQPGAGGDVGEHLVRGTRERQHLVGGRAQHPGEHGPPVRTRRRAVPVGRIQQ